MTRSATASRLAAKHAREIVERLREVDATLVAAGFPAMSPWWRRTIERFYASGRRQLVIRAGRRSGKSSTLCRVAVVEALFGSHEVPPGDVGVVAIVSVSRDEAAGRLRTVRAILDALGVAHRPAQEGQGIELQHRPVQFKVLTASIAGVVGGTVIAAVCDEVAHWSDADTGANPATEVLAMLRPAMATQRQARMFLSSSPLGTEDAHATAYAEGDTAGQLVAHAATWDANPTVTEAETHALEPDARRWARAYAAIPQAGTLGAFDLDAIERAMVGAGSVPEPGRRVVVVDPSSGRKDSWTWCTAGWSRTPEGREVLAFDDLHEQAGRFFDQLPGEQIVERVVALAKARGARVVHADQRESLMLASAFRRHGLGYVVHDWTNPNKQAAVEWLRRAFAENTIVLPSGATVLGEKLRRELLSFEERVTSSGAITFGARGSGHDDLVALLLTAAMAELVRGLPRARSNRARTADDRPAPNHWEREADAAAGRRNGRRVSGPWSWFGGGRGF